MHFCGHGMGLVSHEAPRLTSTGPVPDPGDDAKRPLEEGMVVSIETTLSHPRRGFIRLEDTVAVTAGGYEAFGDAGQLGKEFSFLSSGPTPTALAEHLSKIISEKVHYLGIEQKGRR